jgi:hypothetical protein
VSGADESSLRTRLPNPSQRDIVERLRGDRDARPAYADELRHELRAHLDHRLIPLVERLPASTDVFITKRVLSLVHGCEGRYLAEENSKDFAWSVPVARGKVAHKAIELSVNWRRELLPLTLVDEAIARFEDGDDDFARWLQGCSEVDRAVLRNAPNNTVGMFLECWPPLPSGWRPALERPITQELADRRVVLRGRVDLMIGIPDGLTAGKVIVDFKTGRFSPLHIEDLRFYALVETMRLGVPPLRLADSYLDSGQLHTEEVSENTLRVAVERLVDAVRRIVELRLEERAPRLVASGACRWCPALPTCATGRSHLAGDDRDAPALVGSAGSEPDDDL